MQHFPFITSIGMLAATALAFSQRASQWLQFDRSAISRGQVWRLLTCHFTHWSPAHAFWSILAFLILAAICEAQNRRRTAIVIVGSAIAISLAIFVFRPSLLFYRGLSGVDSALYALAAIHLLRANTDWLMRMAVVGGLLGFAGKIFYEAHTGQLLFADSGGGLVPLPAAHAVGFAIGIFGGKYG
ncbi:MAG TPA: rhombosortase [Tepidisphaeraceae bacterium]|jgi:rhomboid family GlyGly-CTERM serine protease|nr:rhombosortase [Tepidisphaeraceae bacterium]